MGILVGRVRVVLKRFKGDVMFVVVSYGGYLYVNFVFLEYFEIYFVGMSICWRI